MSKIILSMDGRVLKEYQLDKERLTIGRKPENDIHIDNLAVSGRHAAVVTILNDSFLEDLGSTNGTLVNGSPVQKHFLQNNDLIEIGKYKMKYIVEKAMHVEEEAEMDKTMVIRTAVRPPMPNPAVVGKSADGTLSVAPTMPVAGAKPAAAPGIVTPAAAPATPTVKPAVEADRANAGIPAMSVPKPPVPPVIPTPAAAPTPAPTPAPAPPVTPVAEKPVIPMAKPITPAAAPAVTSAAPAHAAGAVAALSAIQILSGPNAGKEMDLAKTLTTLGKPGVQVAVITRRPHGYFITHVEGADFPMVGGEKLDAHPRQLKDHDIIELAGVKMEFFVKI